MEFKAYAVRKTGTDAACESRECLHSMPSSEEEKLLLWVNLLNVNEDFANKHNAEIRFLVHLYLYVYDFLILKVFLAEVGAYVNDFAAVPELLCLGCHVAALEADDAVGQCVELLV